MREERRDNRRLRHLGATVIIGLIAGALVSTVGSSIASSQGTQHQFTTNLTQVVASESPVLELNVVPGTGAPSALEVTIDYNTNTLTFSSCLSLIHI